MSALLPKADMCSATRYVRLVPIADIQKMICATERPPRGGLFLNQIRCFVKGATERARG